VVLYRNYQHLAVRCRKVLVLPALRRQARTIGGLLNQLSAAWNSTGELGGQAGRVLGMVDRVVTDVDVVTARARERLR
jgi:hypothetical protein